MPLAPNSPVNRSRHSDCMPRPSLLATCIVHRLFTLACYYVDCLCGPVRFYLFLLMIITFVKVSGNPLPIVMADNCPTLAFFYVT